MRLVQIILAIALIAAPGAVAAQNAGVYRLDGVTVVGSKRYDAAEIARATGLKVGQTLALGSLQEATGKIGSLGIFTQVSYRYATRGNTMTVVFTVEDAGQLFPCTFGNFVWFPPQELRAGLHSRVPLFDGSVPAAGTMLDVISAALAAMLEARGIHAQVQFVPQSHGGPIESMQFQVVGVPMPVRKIEFTGVQKVDAALLQQAAKPLVDKDYDASSLRDFARGTVVNVYRQRGYLRADFGDPVPQLLPSDPTPNAVAVTLPVTEGEQYRLKEITWSGDSAIPYGDLAKSVRAEIGSPLNAVELEQDVLALLFQFHPKGYLMAEARPNPTLDDATHTVACQIQIRQGDLYRLGKLEFTGLDDAHAKSFAKLSKLHPGDPYDATYWSKFLRDIENQLPPPVSDWKYSPHQTIHADTKTVDVLLTFTPPLIP